MEEIKKTYKPLGPKTLFMMILKRSLIILVLFAGLIIYQSFLSYLPDTYSRIAINLFSEYIVLCIIIVVAVFFLGWLEYFRYGIFLDEKNIKISRGLFSTEQIGIPYRRIQDMRISRSLVDQFIGISNIIISIVAEEDEKTSPDSIILPSLDKKIAEELHDIVLKRAQVEQIHVVKY